MGDSLMTTRLQLDVDTDLILQQLALGDATELFNLADAHREQLSEWMPWVLPMKKISDTRGAIRRMNREFGEGTRVVFGVRHSGTLVGCLDYDIVRPHRVATVGYWLAEPFTGQGIMTRAVRCVITHLFHVEAMNRVQIFCATENRKSRAVPERLQIPQEGVMREREWLNGQFHDHAAYAVLARDWAP